MESKNFISQYVLANGGTAVPIRFTQWCAIGLIGMTLGRKVFIDHAHFLYYPWIHLCLVGESSSKKSTAMGAARSMFLKVFPDAPSGVSVTSRQDVVRFMSSEECKREYIDEGGALVEWRPLYNFVNEFTDWLSFDPLAMIEFLTNIYDQSFYVSSTIKRDKEFILHPFLTIIACTVPGRIIEFMKTSVVGAGFARRILFIYETETPPRILFPTKSKEAYEAESWCQAHLQKINTLVGPFKWDPQARKFLEEWYAELPESNDPVVGGYFNSKDVIVQKLAMCLATAEEEPQLLLTEHHLRGAIALLDVYEQNLPRLTAASGKNILAVAQLRMMEELAKNGGWMPEYSWHRIASADLQEWEYAGTKKMLIDTRQVFEVKVPYAGILEKVICNQAKYVELVKGKQIV